MSRIWYENNFKPNAAGRIRSFPSCRLLALPIKAKEPSLTYNLPIAYGGTR